ncbi:GDP-L-fucose synthase [Desulfobacter hydrogenophilus]|uniref:GDP-L-fucose synthase n=1 Tax=Desulfobacter hydrogenophilus TaxID=2291 RepID=A0A328F6M9_9BACT|nr:GDP-L-fucose synthase [Desulfobacter hydrogenophilus]NDY74284.1 GDP-L-fucose synthase [Desulfobacter hydrogenophilus]QBH15075.1 GDP-L-fucose synthase [Desulfobacter hydrogenophilus]RAM00158.1 GDP-L-fucose synthase [Desulfobacter hydrogenophilus]
MQKIDKIFIAGAAGLVGSALKRLLDQQGYTNILTPGRKELDLMDTTAVAAWFEKHKPNYVFQAAAKVGGILANNRYPADFIHQNLIIMNNVIHQSYLNNVKKLLFLASSCIYPKHCPQPMKEEYLMTGPLEPTNSPYAVAKIAGIEMCWAYNRQYGTKFIPVMPTNLYGANDNFDIETAHVLPALIRKFHEAKLANTPSVTIWGTGSPKREFLHVDDLAKGCCFIMNKDLGESTYKSKLLFNIGAGKDITIKDLALLIQAVTGYEGILEFDASKPDGTPQKLLDVSQINALGWNASIPLHQGISDTYEWYNQSLTKRSGVIINSATLC